MAFNNPAANPQNKNVPIHSEVIVPKEELVPIFIEAHLKKKDAIQRYGTYGRCISSLMLLGNFAAPRLKHTMYTEGLL